MRSQEQQISATERQRRALDMRKAGKSYQAIAATLGYASTGGAHKAVHSALTKTLSEPAEQVRDLELARLDALLEALWPGATGAKTAPWEEDGRPAPEVDIERVDRVLKIMERRAKLLGLDAPTKADVTSKGETLAIILDR